MMRARSIRLAMVALGFAPACGKDDPRPATPATPAAAAPAPDAEDPPEPPLPPEPPEVAETVAAIAAALEPWKGDLDGMVERRSIRVLTVMNRTHYFIDRGKQQGLTYEGGIAFEKFLNERLKLGDAIKVHLQFLPVSRDRLLSALAEGKGDIAAANLTITSEREALVDFATPFTSSAKEVAVTARDAAPVKTPEDLSGREVHVRKSSAYRASLDALNARLSEAGKPPVAIVDADENLEDEDLIEMVDGGLLPATVADLGIADFWAQVYDGIQVNRDAPLREGGRIAWAVRKGCPQLKAAIDDFAEANAKGSLLFNVLYKRYLKDAKRVTNPRGAADSKRFDAAVGLFKKYAEQYDFPWQFLAALAYQESGIDQSKVSSAGAVGIMQIKPSTAEGKPILIRGVETSADRNVEAGTKYLRFIADKHVPAEGLDRVNRALFVCASYNAGPTRIEKLRKQAAKEGLDPNVWFGNVEVAAAQSIGRETVQYVSNIFKYYVAYRLAERAAAADGGRNK